MKKIFILISLLILSTSAWSQDFSDEDQYPEVDPAVVDGGEFTQNQRGLPATDYEEVPREEQEYTPEPNMDDIPPEEVYEADEEFLE